MSNILYLLVLPLKILNVDFENLKIKYLKKDRTTSKIVKNNSLQN